jgi:nucleoside-diphosphate-sugar epimerase
MKILVTGVSGYAGFYAALCLADAGHTVTGITRRPDNPRLDRLRVHEVAIVEGDLGRCEDLAGAFAESDVIVHALLDRRDPEGIDRRLFAALAALPERPGARRRLVYTTGCSIYGKRPERVMDETTPANPEHALAFRMRMEQEALALMPRLGIVVLRPGFLYGGDGQTSLAATWFAMGEAGNPVLRGNPAKGWSWVHVADLGRAYRLAAEAAQGIDGEIFCIADENRPTCLEVMRACVAAVGYRGEVRCEAADPAVRDPTGSWFDQNEFITSAKARRLLGWTPRHTGVVDRVIQARDGWRAGGRARA